MNNNPFSKLIKKINKNEIIIGFMIFFFSIYIYIESIQLPDFGKSFESPGLLPAFIAVVMFFLSIFMIIGELKKGFLLIKAEEGLNGVKKEEIDTGQREPLWDLRVFLAILIILLYVFVLPYISFLIASILFLFIMMFFLKAGNVFLIGLISVLIPLGIQYLFANVFQQLIP